MLRKVRLLLALIATVGAGTASASSATRDLTNIDKPISPTKAMKDAHSKAKEVTLCLSGSRLFSVNPLPEIPPNNVVNSLSANFISEVFDCADVQPGTGAQDDRPVAGASKLGQVSWTCSWVQPYPATALSNLKLASCTGLLTLKSSWHKKTDLSTAAFSFWADTSKFVTGTVSSPIAPIVTATNGAWPKPEMVTGFDWGIVGNKLQLTIKYKTRGWNPASPK